VPASEVGEGGTFVLTGVMASGKSTVADLLARRFERAVHLRGDVFRKMIVAGRDPISPPIGEEARRQLALRHRLAAQAAEEYRRAGFTVVLQDIYLGDDLDRVVSLLPTAPVFVVALVPTASAVTERARRREKGGYGEWSVEELCAGFEAETPRIGLWLDTTSLTPEETVDTILSRRGEARVR